MTLKVDLLIIDPQNDFCRKQTDGAALSVAGADEDMNRLAAFINTHGDKLNDIHVTLDSHHLFDIAHPIFWKNFKGENPAPFTIITLDDVKKGVWMTTIPSLQELALSYVQDLENGKRYPLCIWPPHCLIGTPGHNVFQPISDALLKWEKIQLANVDYITKGSNPFTEHYSAVSAEVCDQRNPDPSILPNARFFEMLERSDIVLIAGEASSHCVANTVMDMINKFPGADQYTKKLVFLKDASSPVGGFEDMETRFLDEMKAKGMEISSTTTFWK